MAGKSVGYLTFNFGANMGGFNKAMKKAQSRVKKFGKSMKSVGSSMTRGLTMPIIGLGAIAVKTFASFEQAMLKVKAISGATGEEFKLLEGDAKRLGSSTMFTASQVAELQLNLSKLGLTPKEINKSTESILSLAQATGSDLGQAATVAASTMKGFGLEAKDMNKIADVMADAFSSTALDMDKFQTAMASVAPVAKQAGASLETTTAVLGTLVNRGVDASSAGAALRNIFLDLAKEGMSWEEAMNKIQNSTNPLADSMEMFGKRGATVATIIANNRDEITGLTTDFQDSTGEAKKMADIMDSGVAGTLRKLQSQAEGVAITLGEMLIPVFSKLMGWVQKGLAAWSGLESATKQTVVAFGLFAAGIGPAISAVGFLATAFGFLLSPIGLVIAALAGIVYVMVTNWGVVKKALVETINYFIGLYNESMIFRGVINLVIMAFKNLWAHIKFFGKAGWAIISAFGNNVKNIFKSIGQIIKGALTFNWDELKAGFSSFGENIVDILASDELVTATKEFGEEIATNLDDAVKNTLDAKDPIELITEEDVDNTIGNVETWLTDKKDKLKGLLQLGGGSGGGEGGGEEEGQEPMFGDMEDATETYEQFLKRTKKGGEDTTKTLKEVWSKFWDDWGEGVKNTLKAAETLLNSFATLNSSITEKENVEFQNSKTLQEEALQTEYDNKVAAIERDIVDEEAKKEALKELDATFGDDKIALEERMAAKEKILQKKQAKREKAMGIFSAIISGVQAVMAAFASVPFPFSLPLAVAVGAIAAANVATIASTPLPMAEGGLISGPTVGLMGEYPGAKNNPEVVAPLNKLQNMIGNQGDQNIVVTGRISGNDIFLANERAANNRQRFI